MTESQAGEHPAVSVDRGSLVAIVERARQAFERLHLDHERAIADPDVIQEDRESARLLAEQAEHAAEAAEEALARFDRGAYGICEKCGKSISAERLEAVPDARTCRDCWG